MPTVKMDDGVSIAYQTRGTGPLNLLFLHGWAGFGSWWEEMIQHLDLAGLRLILADLRGHGESDKPADGYTLERFSRDMFAVANHAEADRVVLIGYSMSGRFAQFMACERPERVLGQVLIGPAAASPFPLPPEIHQAWVACAGKRDAFRDLLPPFIKEPLRPDVVEHFLDGAVKVPAVALDGTLRMCAAPSFIERLATLRVPTLVIGGAHDPMMSEAFLREAIVSRITGARLVMLDCGHETPLEKPQETAALLEAFLAGLG
jgi:pimeloyl-ACP methyl ester carboxylesterase